MTWIPNVTRVPNTDFRIDASLGNYAKTAPVIKFGRSELITSIKSVVWDAGGTYVFPAAAETLDIVSTSTDDAAAGDGARTAIIYGLDVNYNEIYEAVTLEGTTVVTTTQEFFRVYRAFVLTTGTPTIVGGSNVGAITISGSSSALTLAKILAGNGQTLMMVYTVPAGKKMVVVGLSGSVGQGKNVCLHFSVRNGGDPSINSFSLKYTLDLYQASFTTVLSVPLVIPEKTDTAVTGVTDSGTVNCSAAISGYLYDV